MDENAIGKQIVDAAVQIHRELEPGLLETDYEGSEVEWSLKSGALAYFARNQQGRDQGLKGSPSEFIPFLTPV